MMAGTLSSLGFVGELVLIKIVMKRVVTLLNKLKDHSVNQRNKIILFNFIVLN